MPPQLGEAWTHLDLGRPRAGPGPGREQKQIVFMMLYDRILTDMFDFLEGFALDRSVWSSKTKGHAFLRVLSSLGALGTCWTCPCCYFWLNFACVGSKADFLM